MSNSTLASLVDAYRSLREPERKKVLAAAQWGDGPFTRLILQRTFSTITPDQIPPFIQHLAATEI
jgi:hypothetical protein